MTNLPLRDDGGIDWAKMLYENPKHLSMIHAMQDAAAAERERCAKRLEEQSRRQRRLHPEARFAYAQSAADIRAMKP